MLRFLLVLLSVTECGAVRPNNALERRRAALCVQAATAMWTAASSVRLWASNADEEDLIDMLVLIAGETLIRRQLFVPGEMRFSVGRLQSLFSQVHSFTDTVANVVANFRFQAHDLHRLRTGARKALRPPSHGHSTHSCARLPPHSGLRIPDRFSTRSRYAFSGDEGLLLLLYKLHWPTRVVDVAEEGGRSMSAASECFAVRTRNPCCPYAPSPPQRHGPQCPPMVSWCTVHDRAHLQHVRALA